MRAAVDGRPEHVLSGDARPPETPRRRCGSIQIEELVAELTSAHGEALPPALRAPASTGVAR